MAGTLLNTDDWSLFESETGPHTDTLVVRGANWEVPRVVAEVRRQKSRIIANWALRVANLPAFRAMPNLALDEVQRHIPLVLDGALTAIATSDQTMDPEPLARASDLASAHGRARLQDEFGIGDVLAEFHALRREVWSALWRVVEGEGESIGLLRELDRRLSETFDAIAVAAAEAWVSSPSTGNGR
ncbi:MAG: RsbRD N-terminal domain-containing protein [Thermomicrobiales bacterium]|nr:RsbRD N-terminal domain-containing protein [Thermomicrobiales bacterium]